MGSVVCIGVFDGVHAGHRALIAEARAEADALGAPLIAVTFDPHPAAVLRPIAAPRSLASLDERVRLLQDAGADEVDILRFDQRMSTETPAEFADFLVAQFGAAVVVVGANFRFGAGATGDVSTLRELGDSRGFRVRSVALRSDGEPWSSTRIRSLLMEGQIEAANRILGRAYRLEGIVVHGDHRGRELGYPTANLRVEGSPVIPADGIYAGWLTVAGSRYPAAISVGTNPQFGGDEQRVEAFAIDRSGLDLYGHPAAVDFTDFLRPQAVFDSLADFLAQMRADVDRARALLAGAS